ncbi:hypothetical protein [Halopseudomonas sp.]|uniref:ImmA/IrrE family metallo-endopeptidase n=1 Tax=Halopseudomonas sp. TaxID=2901191 RepID=UPI00311E2541
MIKRFCWIVVLLSLSAASHAQMFAGWDAFCGIRVIGVPNPQIASAAMDSSGPVIYADPGVMANWTMSRVFTLAHECGHHRKGHVTPQGMWFRNQQFWATRAQELEADCWAAEALSQTRDYADLKRTIHQFASQGPLMQGNYPSGLERAQTIARCAGVPFDFSPYLPASACATPTGSCHLTAPLPRNAACFCPSPRGPVNGVTR